MTQEELRKIGEQLFGKWGWQTKLAKALRVDGSTVRRWIAGTTNIPGPAIVALELLTQQMARQEKERSPMAGKKTSSGCSSKFPLGGRRRIGRGVQK